MSFGWASVRVLVRADEIRFTLSLASSAIQEEQVMAAKKKKKAAKKKAAKKKAAKKKAAKTRAPKKAGARKAKKPAYSKSGIGGFSRLV